MNYKVHRCRITAVAMRRKALNFSTINLLERRADLLVRHIDSLREAVKCTRADRSFHIDAWVVLPDHMHCVITLPPGDDDLPNRIKAMKICFLQALPPTERRSSIRMAKGERGIWQRRFWEHAIRDEGDLVTCHSAEHPCGASALPGLRPARHESQTTAAVTPRPADTPRPAENIVRTFYLSTSFRRRSSSILSSGAI